MSTTPGCTLHDTRCPFRNPVKVPEQRRTRRPRATVRARSLSANGHTISPYVSEWRKKCDEYNRWCMGCAQFTVAITSTAANMRLGAVEELSEMNTRHTAISLHTPPKHEQHCSLLRNNAGPLAKRLATLPSASANRICTRPLAQPT